MAYAYFQPRLLERFGFVSLAGLLTWYLAFAGTTLAPLAGDASDRLVRRGGSRFPVVRAGVALAAASFVAVAVTARAEGGSPARFLLPLFVGIWIAGMTLFQSPALAIVRDTGDPGDLPRLVSPVVVATTLPAALWPWIEPILARLGGSVTFLAGGLAVTATAFALGSTATLPARPAADPEPSAGAARLPLALAFGLVSALVVVIATERVPAAGGSAIVSPVTLATVVGLAAAVSASAMGRARREAREPDGARGEHRGRRGVPCRRAVGRGPRDVRTRSTRRWRARAPSRHRAAARADGHAGGAGGARGRP